MVLSAEIFEKSIAQSIHPDRHTGIHPFISSYLKMILCNYNFTKQFESKRKKPLLGVLQSFWALKNHALLKHHQIFCNFAKFGKFFHWFRACFTPFYGGLSIPHRKKPLEAWLLFFFSHTQPLILSE